MISFSLVSPRPVAYSRSRSCCLRWRRLRMRNLYCCHSHRHRTRCTRRRIHCANRPCIRCIRDPTPRRSSSSSPMATTLSKHIADATILARCDRIRWWWVAAWRSNYYIYILFRFVNNVFNLFTGRQLPTRRWLFNHSQCQEGESRSLMPDCDIRNSL